MRDDAGVIDPCGATPAALAAYREALAAWQAWRGGADAHLERALGAAPRFVLAHVLRAWMLGCSRDPHSVEAARPIVARAARLPANARERLHLAALSALLADDYDGAKSRLGEALRQSPHDALALQAAHALDYLTGDTEQLRQRTAAVLPAWHRDMPGYHAVLAMHAFGLVETGDPDRADAAAHAALALAPADARACHVLAHVYEMSGRPAAGERWMLAHEARWGGDTAVARHAWWHVALFQLAQGRVDRALATYDRSIGSAPLAAVGDLVDASALLWRVALAGGDPGDRWRPVADAWTPRIEDRFCSFTDLHAMLAFVGAGADDRAQRLEQVLAAARRRPTRYGETTRRVGLGTCRAVRAFGAGRDRTAIALLGRVPSLLGRIGGSHAQRDVVLLTLRCALERTWGRVSRRRGGALCALGASA